ncbi:P12 family lipoprotein (plasmid) [Borrelia parkeri]|uniref:P12 family lipoprotein n=1 Tax=Borrelia parkeri TaxID=141 RepID=UPI001FF254EA|nr:P12 family lipoprotein [Borrelia parkeri]UPA11574.1 P12 family lipoprotein [Borrelia parkeri]
MKKNVLAVCMLTLLCLLSCDLNVLNELLVKSRESCLENLEKNKKDKKDLNSIKENQEGEEKQADIINNIEERVGVISDMEVVPVVPLTPVNAEIPVFQNYPYYPFRKKIEIKEEDLIPSTKVEQEAYKAIKDIESILKGSGFQQLIENSRELKDEYERLKVDLYNTLSKLQEKRSFKGLSLGNRFRKNRMDIESLNRWYSWLREEYSNFERLINEIDIAIQDIWSAEKFFERAQKTLKEAIIKRLENSTNWRHRLSYVPAQLSGIARSDAEISLKHIESYSRIGEAKGRKKDIEKLIKEAKSYLENLSW